MLEKEFGGTRREEGSEGEQEELAGGVERAKLEEASGRPLVVSGSSWELDMEQCSLLSGSLPHVVTYKPRKRLCPVWCSLVLPRERFLGGRGVLHTGHFRGVRAQDIRINGFFPMTWVGLG